MGKRFRWIDAIRTMSIEELASYLIKEDFTFKDGIYWKSPSGEKFDYYDLALEDCIKWLNSKYDGKEKFNGTV